MSTKAVSSPLPSLSGQAAHGRSNRNGALTPSSSQSFNMPPSPLHASSPSGRYSSHSGSSSGGTLSSESGLGVVISGGHGLGSPLPTNGASQLSPNHAKNFQYQTYNGYSQGTGGTDGYVVEEGYSIGEDGTLTDGRRRKSSRSSTQPSTPGYGASFASMQQPQYHTGYTTAQGTNTHPARGVVVGPGMLPTPSSSRSGDDSDVRDLRREKPQRSSKSQKVKVHDYGSVASSQQAPLMSSENSYLSPGGLQPIPLTPSRSGSGMGDFFVELPAHQTRRDFSIFRRKIATGAEIRRRQTMWGYGHQQTRKHRVRLDSASRRMCRPHCQKIMLSMALGSPIVHLIRWIRRAQARRPWANVYSTIDKALTHPPRITAAMRTSRPLLNRLYRYLRLRRPSARLGSARV